MSCDRNKPFYIPAVRRGLKLASNIGDGNIVQVYFHEAFTDSASFNLAYNIYYSSERDLIFSDGPKFISLNIGGLKAVLTGFSPGDIYYFAVRATEYSSSWYNPALLPQDGYDGYLHVYPETLLLNSLSTDSSTIEIADISLFPPYGVVRVGAEYIKYDSKDIPNDSLIIAERGFDNTNIRFHETDGYDGYSQWSPIVRFYPGFEDDNNFVIQTEIKLSPPYNNFVVSDGYKTKVDLLTTDLSASDANRVDFQSYDFSGWHRTDPVRLFNGECIDSYIGGEYGCSDGYLGVGNMVRGIPLNTISDQREEELLSLTGEPVCLFRRMWKGIVCHCVQSNKESPESRCQYCYGTGYIGGYEQYFNPRQSDGRIMVRFGPYTDDLKRDEVGLESFVTHDCWTLVVPAIRDSDFIIRFNEDGSEEYRYEVLDVTRNKLLFGQSGKQNFKAQRVRKTDPIYQVASFRNTASMPLKIITTVGLLRGPNGTVIPHTHEVIVNENITAISQINEMTSISAGHNHVVRAGQILEGELLHTHNIIL